MAGAARPGARTGDRMSEFESRNRQKISDIGADSRLYELTREWFERSSRHEYPYHFTWMGLPIIQFPQDIVAMQEIIWRVQPDLIIETGVARGGSVVFYASLLELIGGDGRVIGIDVDIRAPNRAAIEASSVFKRIDLIEGSSTAADVVERVRSEAARASRVLVSLDSNHTHAHVLEELRAYAPCVTQDSYLVVFDTSIEHLSADALGDRPWGPGNSPATAIREFLATTDRFIIDTEMDHKLLITEAPGGYLKCVKR
jgi:cephalosporin hydroxylase